MVGALSASSAKGISSSTALPKGIERPKVKRRASRKRRLASPDCRLASRGKSHDVAAGAAEEHGFERGIGRRRETHFRAGGHGEPPVPRVHRPRRALRVSGRGDDDGDAGERGRSARGDREPGGIRRIASAEPIAQLARHLGQRVGEILLGAAIDPAQHIHVFLRVRRLDFDLDLVAFKAFHRAIESQRFALQDRGSSRRHADDFREARALRWSRKD